MSKPAMLFLLALSEALFRVAPASAQSCPLLSAAEVEKSTGTHVQEIAFGSKPGAGGKCANFATDNGRLYLGITALASIADYQTAVAAVPEAIYPQRAKLPDVGDEAVLMKSGNGALRYLIAHKGDRGVILLPFGPQLSDEMLKRLAAVALSH